MTLRSVVSNLLHGGSKVLNNDDGLFRVVDAEPEQGVHFDGNAISGDRFLLLNGVRDDAKINAGLILDTEWN
jgi:hypothetical protein